MNLVVAGVFGAVGLVSVVGGAVGYKKANSVASLVAGCASGCALLLASGLTAMGSLTWGLGLGALSCVALAGRFIPAYVRSRRIMPHGIMAALSSVGVLSALIAVALS